MYFYSHLENTTR